MAFYPSIENDVFNGTAITSFTFPTSITSLGMIEDYALRGMD